MIKDVLKPMSEVGLSNEALQKKNCMQNGRRYQQRRRPERLSVETRPNGYELTVGQEKFFYYTRLALFAGVMIHVWMEPEKSFDWPVPLKHCNMKHF